MPPYSIHPYHHLTLKTATLHATQPSRAGDWDKGALMIIAIIAIPTIAVASVAILLAL